MDFKVITTTFCNDVNGQTTSATHPTLVGIDDRYRLPYEILDHGSHRTTITIAARNGDSAAVTIILSSNGVCSGPPTPFPNPFD